MKIAVKEVGKELQIVETSQKYRTDCAKEYTGKEDRAEYVKLNNNGTLVIAVNENGLLHEMPTNFLLATTNPKYPIQKNGRNSCFYPDKICKSMGYGNLGF